MKHQVINGRYLADFILQALYNSQTTLEYSDNGMGWSPQYITLVAGKWRFCFFIDSGELDYLEWAQHGNNCYSYYSTGIDCVWLDADPLETITKKEREEIQKFVLRPFTDREL